mmetsp:Transcript_40610/g.79680  ORF Transcript_40610/g.79680 Transcript_40610/m.79680 type:complete len:219 (+) Transcript_40610:133-789(+)
MPKFDPLLHTDGSVSGDVRPPSPRSSKESTFLKDSVRRVDRYWSTRQTDLSVSPSVSVDSLVLEEKRRLSCAKLCVINTIKLFFFLIFLGIFIGMFVVSLEYGTAECKLTPYCFYYSIVGAAALMVSAVIRCVYDNGGDRCVERCENLHIVGCSVCCAYIGVLTGLVMGSVLRFHGDTQSCNHEILSFVTVVLIVLWSLHAVVVLAILIFTCCFLCVK